MIRGSASVIIASFFVVLGTACTDVEPTADEPSAEAPLAADPGLAIESCSPEIADLAVTQPDGTKAPCEHEAKSTTTHEVAASYVNVGVGDCTFAVYSPSPSGRNGFAQLGCAYNENLELEVCLQQLVTGGWQTINWTCATTHSLSYYVDEHSGQVPYYTSGRWYRTWAWAYANGATRAVVSGGFQG
jgi:hypothetical protein